MLFFSKLFFFHFQFFFQKFEFFNQICIFCFFSNFSNICFFHIFFKTLPGIGIYVSSHFLIFWTQNFHFLRPPKKTPPAQTKLPTLCCSVLPSNPPVHLIMEVEVLHDYRLSSCKSNMTPSDSPGLCHIRLIIFSCYSCEIYIYFLNQRWSQQFLAFTFWFLPLGIIL